LRDLLGTGMAATLRSLARPGTLVVLDFDGTLAPIVGDRRAAGLSPRSRAALRRLARLYPVAVLSGRGAADVRSRLSGLGVRWVVGSHGAEWPGEGGAHRTWRRQVGGWRATLASRLSGLAGVELEAKPLSLAVHFRHSRSPGHARARIDEAVTGLPGAALVPGKKVVNLVPAGAGDKGTALRRLVEVAGAARVLFVGDDVTDEAAFAARLEVPAVMARVGRDPQSRAGAWLRRRAEVDVLLERLCELREAAETRPPVRHEADLAPAGEVEELGATLAFMKELWALEQGLNRHSRAMLRRHGVTGPQRMAVRVVGRLTPVSPARLARVLHLHPSSVTRLVRRLEVRGLIRRSPDPDHRGRLLLEVGPAGRRLERIEVGSAESIVRAALRRASPRDVEATRRVLAQLTDQLAPRAGEETA